MLGDRGQAFVVAQTRLAGGRIHHAMRAVGQMKLAFEMLCERAVSRFTQDERLSSKQLVQEMVADAWIEIEQFRLLVLQTAWKIDRYGDYKRVRGDISAVKVAAPKVLQSVATKALQVHGSLGISDEMPFVACWSTGSTSASPTGHRSAQVDAGPPDPCRRRADVRDVPSRHIPALKEEAERKYAATWPGSEQRDGYEQVALGATEHSDPAVSAPFSPGTVMLGLHLSAGDAREAVRSLREQAVAAERAGFDGIGLSEHHGGFPGYAPTPIVLAGALVAATNASGARRVRPCCPPPQRRCRRGPRVAGRLLPRSHRRGVRLRLPVGDFELVGADFEHRMRAFADALPAAVRALAAIRH